jgi:hypothetical protein
MICGNLSKEESFFIYRSSSYLTRSFRIAILSTPMSEAAFRGFFQTHDELRELRPVAHEFYRAVRCSVLHQAETTHGWRVRSKPGPLLEQQGDVHWINASAFAARLKTVVTNYCESLRTSDWQSQGWKSARRKLQSICKNCGVTNVDGLA